jgi:hypothetical protein
MNPMPLEYRILRVLILGSATVSEMALRLCEPRYSVDYRSRDLAKHRLVRICGTTHKPRTGGNAAYRFELTPEGREWAREMIGGTSCY